MAAARKRPARSAERRNSGAENPSIPLSAANFLEHFGLGSWGSASGVTVNLETALSVPAFWAAVNFIAGTLAGLPLQLYRRTGDKLSKVKGGLATILSDAANDELTSFQWRKGLFENALTGGRGLTFIERTPARAIINLWPLDPTKTSVRRVDGRRFYDTREGRKTHTYEASEIIDIPFMLKPNGLDHRSPIVTLRDAIGLAISGTQYGSKFFQNGGVPPFAVTGAFTSGASLLRAANDLEDAVRKATKERRLALTLPNGLDIKSLGVDVQKAQLVELKRFCIEEVARIFSLPPVFLQDLTHGTFSNNEQQDLHFVKHTLMRWVLQFEQELNLKLFGRINNRTFVKANVDGLLRGDFKTRMDGYAVGIQNAVITPNEARDKENLDAHPLGDDLLIQGATVPLGKQPDPNAAPKPKPGNEPPPADDPTNGDSNDQQD